MTYREYKGKILKDSRAHKINFNKDNRLYYVYRITDTETNEHYYGSRKSILKNPLKDLLNYNSSSKRKKDIIKNKEKYKFKIVRVFDNIGDKIIFESFLHSKFNVKSNNNFFNESNQTPFGFDTTGKEPWNKGRVDLGGYKHTNKRESWSVERKKKLSEKMLGHKKISNRNYSDVSKDKVVVVDKNGNKSKIDKSEWNKETHTSISKGSLTVTDIRNNNKSRVSQEEFNNNRFLVANGSKWFYMYDGIVYRKSDLHKLMKIKNIECNIQTFIKRIKKINCDEYIRALIP